jgi:hypothetical protein
MARRRPPSGKKKGRPREEEPDYDDDIEDDIGGTADARAAEAQQLLTALLIVAFAFIFLGVLLTWHHLHKHYDTPFLLVMQKSPENEVKRVAARDFGGVIPAGDEEEGDEEEGGEDEGGEEGGEEGDEEYSEE